MFLVFWRITLRRFSSTISLFRWNNTAVFSGKDNTWTFSEPFWQQLPYKTVGIEPKSSVFYKYSSTELSKKESNLRLWKIQLFSINYALIFLVDIGGFEPPTAPLSGVYSTNWAKYPFFILYFFKLVWTEGIEPSLLEPQSSALPLRHIHHHWWGKEESNLRCL